MLSVELLRVENLCLKHVGCGLAGGTWDKVEELVKRRLSRRGLTVVVYDLPEE